MGVGKLCPLDSVTELYGKWETVFQFIPTAAYALTPASGTTLPTADLVFMETKSSIICLD